MKTPLLLKQYEYEILASPVALFEMIKTSNKGYLEYQPLIKLNIDFKNGHLNLDADWQYMVLASKYSDAAWLTYHETRVFIDATLYPALSINLYDSISNGLVLPLRGYIKDSDMLSPCSGLLVLDNTSSSNEPQWKITAYLCDLKFDNCELNVQFPVYV